MKNRNTLLLLGIFFVSLISRTILIIRFPDLHGGDTWFYLQESNLILNNWVSYYLSNLTTPYYWGYPTFLGLIKLVSKKEIVIIFIQIIISSLSVVYLYKTLILLKVNKHASLLLSIYYAFFFETLKWDGVILSDSLGLSLSIFLIYVYYNFVNTGKMLGAFVLLSLLLLLTRTNSFILVFILILSLVFNLKGKTKIVSIFSFSIILFLILLSLYLNTSNINGLASRFIYYKEYFQSGTIIKFLPEYDYHIDNSHYGSAWIILDYLLMTLKKIVMFWSIYLSSFSVLHKFINLILLLPVYLLFIISIILRYRNRSLINVLTIVILSYNVIQALSEIDADLRYRIAIFPLIFIFIGTTLFKQRNIEVLKQLINKSTNRRV